MSELNTKMNDRADKEPVKTDEHQYIPENLLKKCGDELVGVFTEIHNTMFKLSSVSSKSTKSYLCYYVDG